MQLERPRQQQHITISDDVVYHAPSSLGPAPLPPDFSQVLVDNDGGGPSTQAARDQAHASSSHLVSEPSVASSSSSSAAAAERLVSSIESADAQILTDVKATLQRCLKSLRLPGLSPSPLDDNATAPAAGPSSSFTASTRDHTLATLQRIEGDLANAVDSLDDPFSAHEMRQLATTSVGQRDTHTTVQSILRHLDALALRRPSPSTTSARDLQEARAQLSLLCCTDRLKSLYRSSPRLADPAQAVTSPPTSASTGVPLTATSSSVGTAAVQQRESPYAVLQAHARQLQLSSSALVRGDSHDSSSTLLAVEEAEVDLLWGRIDDLLDSLEQDQLGIERIQEGTIPVASRTAPQTLQQVINGNGVHPALRRTADYDLLGPTPAMANDDATFTNSGDLPEYAALNPPEYSASSQQQDGDSFTANLKGGGDHELEEVGHIHQAHHKGATEEKLAIDLDRVTNAIERMYVASPQLSNQRVDTQRPTKQDRAQMREAQLARLSAAVEKLSKGRMEGQRAALSPNTPVTSMAKGKWAESKEESLNKLLDTLDKAAGRTMDDQRVNLSKRQYAAIQGAQQTARAAATDLKLSESKQLAFARNLFDSVDKGRMTSQDAVFTSRPSTGDGHTSAPANVTQFSSKVNGKRRSMASVIVSPTASKPGLAVESSDLGSRGRSYSVGNVPPVPSIPTEHMATPIGKLKEGHRESSSVKKRFSMSRLLSARDGSTMGRSKSKTSPASSRPNSFYQEQAKKLHYVVEEMRNISTMHILAWDDRFGNPSQAQPLAQEAWSANCLDANTLQLATDHDSATVLLATAAAEPRDSAKKLDMVFKGDYYELHLPTAESEQTTRQRSDFELHSVYPAAEFRKHKPQLLVCSSCGEDLVDLSRISRYNDLPSEHWAELLDAWMCHHDQTLSEELIAKGNNIWPKGTQALLSSGAVLLAVDNVRSWVEAKDLESTIGPDGYWAPIRCGACGSLIGQASSGPTQPHSPEPAFIRLDKYAIQPAKSSMPVASLSAHITARLLETSLATAVHRFLIEDTEQGSLWLFNPHVRLSSSNTSMYPSFPLSAVKIFYRSTHDMDENGVASMLGTSEYATLTYPSRICSQIHDLLELSTQVYPANRQAWGDWTVGWLARSPE